MNHIYRFVLFVILILGVFTLSYSKHFISADNPDIQYYGRWDMADPLINSIERLNIFHDGKEK